MKTSRSRRAKSSTDLTNLPNINCQNNKIYRPKLIMKTCRQVNLSPLRNKPSEANLENMIAPEASVLLINMSTPTHQLTWFTTIDIQDQVSERVPEKVAERRAMTYRHARQWRTPKSHKCSSSQSNRKKRTHLESQDLHTQRCLRSRLT